MSELVDRLQPTSRFDMAAQYQDAAAFLHSLDEGLHGCSCVLEHLRELPPNVDKVPLQFSFGDDLLLVAHHAERDVSQLGQHLIEIQWFVALHVPGSQQNFDGLAVKDGPLAWQFADPTPYQQESC